MDRTLSMKSATMTSRAALADGHGGFVLEDIQVHPPGPEEVRVRLAASGLCHTDHDSMGWGRPLVLGHEGAGMVESVGAGVTHVVQGDRVLLNWAISCGSCFQCQHGNHALCEKHSPVAGVDSLGGHAHSLATTLGDRPVERSFHLGTLSEWTVVRQEAVIKLPEDIPWASACILGCGVMTGFGSVVNAAKVQPGQSVVVLGCGGVGLNVIQGARIAGAFPIIAVDVLPKRLEMATYFGATHTIMGDKGDLSLQSVTQEVRALTDQRGADVAFEATANPALGEAPLRLVRHGGKAVQVSGIEEVVSMDMRLFEWDKTYLNLLYGKCCPEQDFPILFEHYRQKRLLLDELVSRVYSLDELSDAFAHMLEGRNAKGVVQLIPESPDGPFGSKSGK